jgi:hypothetical protein
LGHASISLPCCEIQTFAQAIIPSVAEGHARAAKADAASNRWLTKAARRDRATAPGASREDAKVEAKLQKAAEIKALLDAPLFEPAPMVLS